MRNELSTRNGLRIREAVLRLLSDDLLREQVSHAMEPDSMCAVIERALPPDLTELVRADLLGDPGWKREYWLLDEAADVHRVDVTEFRDARPDMRFSRYWCLRVPDRDALALRGLLSAALDQRSLAVLSQACGRPVRFASVDIGRYDHDDYLRRHSDVFGDRVFGMVWFFAEGHPPQAGGELVVEAPDGASIVVRPAGGSVAIIPFRAASHHLVTVVRDHAWCRLSVAIHYALADDDEPTL